MNRTVRTAWIVALVAAVAALVDLLIRPVHWERTLALLVVIAVIAAAIALTRSRRTTTR